MNRPLEEVFNWHFKDRIVERGMPSHENIKILHSERRPNLMGSRLSFRVKFLEFFSITVNLAYTNIFPGKSFNMIAKNNLFSALNYEMAVIPQNAHTSEIIDSFTFSHAFPGIFNPIIDRLLRKRLSRILTYKHEVIDHDSGMLKKYPFEKPLQVLISGARGLIGKNLAYFLECAGHDVWSLSRLESKEKKTVTWNPKTGACDVRQFEGFDVVVHLAGEPIGKGRWTKKKKERILKSRSKGTENLAQIIKGLDRPPKVFISASAIGYYGNQGDKVVNETSSPGKDLFISEVCKQWERASRELEEKKVRVVHTRFGVVLSSAGGALQKMLALFKWGMGGKLGKGQQYVSWVAIDDVVGSIYHIIMTPSLKGAVNVVAPNPVPNDVLTKKLAKRLNRWRGLSLPAFAIRMILGQKGEELLLTSTRVQPRRLNASGYHFHYPKLTQALEHVV
ncbi:MAG: TIGR01777 family oxidoreductase [Simkaniaceae bacterium]|nr:TIGR01777 family oxidoreductase [Simkaniaceae bacterium]